jgi:hypothetical protein
MYQLASAPQSIGGVLDNGFKLFRECFTRVFFLAAAATLVYAPLGLTAAWMGVPPDTGRLGVFFLVLLVILLASLMLSAAVVARIDAIAHGGDKPASEALAIGVRRGPAMLGAGILYAIAICIGLLLLIVPGLILMVSLLFGPYATVTDRLGPLGSLQYSRRLVRGHWWRTAALVTIGAIIVSVLYFILAFVAGVAVATNPEAFLGQNAPWYIDFVLSPLLSGLAAPLGYSLFLAMYYDLKLRHEGGDIAERIASATA